MQVRERASFVAADGFITLTHEQRRFLSLHARFEWVTTWQWIFQGTQLRATTETGRTATITATELGALCDFGLAECFGVAGVKLTDRGREFA